MTRAEYCRVTAWPLLVVVACVLGVIACQDGTGPVPTSPDGKPAMEGVKPPPPPPPAPADPAIVTTTFKREKGSQGQYTSYLHVMNVDGSNFTTIFSNPRINDNFLMSPSWSPDGGSIVFLRRTACFNPPEDPCTVELTVIDVAIVNGVPTGTDLRVLLTRGRPPAPAGSIMEPAWSPLGDRIAFIGTDGAIETIPAMGGDPQVVYTPPSAARSVAWSRDGSRIAFSTYDADAGVQVIRAVDVVSGLVTTLVGPELTQPITQGEWIRYIDWGRTRDVLTFSTGWDPRKIYTVEIPGGFPTLVTEGLHPTWSPDDIELVFVGTGGGVSKVSLTSGLITALGPGTNWADWRRFQ